MVRPTLVGLAAAAVGAAGALILGEYAFEGLVVLCSGAVLGLFVGEAAIAVARRREVRLGIFGAAVSIAAMVWAAWISTGHDLSYVGPAGWASVGVAAVAAYVRTGVIRRGSGSPPAAPAPAASTEDPPPT